MSPLRTIIAGTAVLLSTAATAQAAVQPLDLTLVGRTPAQGEERAEIAAFDPPTKRAFTTNAKDKRLDVWNLTTPSSPTSITSVDLSSYGTPNSVATSKRCGGIVAVAVEAPVKTDPGKVLIIRPATGAIAKVLTVGSQPDMLTFTPGGTRLLVANEGEPADNGAVDPKGTVSIISGFPNINCTDLTVNTLDFSGTGFAKYGDIRVFGPNAQFDTNVEPEYITTNDDGTKAYVTLQEANAVATIDIVGESVVNVRGLGAKDYGNGVNKLDASDRDSAINIRGWNGLYGMYQPDAISWFTTGGNEYLITADEGDTREWAFYNEGVRLNDASYKLDPTAFPDAATLKQNANLGRLNVTKASGDTDNDGDYDRIYTFGGRGVSIIDPSATGGVSWDSGPALEEFTAGLGNLSLFNPDHSATATFDDRSDNKGPEPEGVTVGRIANRPYAFVGLERQSGIVAFDLRDKVGQASIAGYINTRPADRGPEGLAFVSPADSPTGQPLILVTNEISGTLAIYTASVA